MDCVVCSNNGIETLATKLVVMNAYANNVQCCDRCAAEYRPYVAQEGEAPVLVIDGAPRVLAIEDL